MVAHALLAIVNLSRLVPPNEPPMAFIVDIITPPPPPIALTSPAPTPVPPPPVPPPTVKPVKAVKPAPVNPPDKVEAPTPVVPVVTQETSPVTATLIVPEKKVEPTYAPTPAPAPPTPIDTQQERNQYGTLLAQEIARHKQYPMLAKKIRQQGSVILQVKITHLGKLITAQVQQSSGHELLDNQAMEMVRKATPFSPPPNALGDEDLTLLVPVSFRLN
jgi:protein TonB